jgi:hypothetical protein
MDGGEQLGRRSFFLDSGATEVVEGEEEEDEQEAEGGEEEEQEEQEQERRRRQQQQQQQRQDIPHILWNPKVRSIPYSQEPTTCR